MTSTKFRRGAIGWIAGALLVAAFSLSAFGLVPNAFYYLTLVLCIGGAVYTLMFAFKKQTPKRKRVLMVFATLFLTCAAAYSILRVTAFPANTPQLRMIVILAGIAFCSIGGLLEYVPQKES